MTKRLGVVFLWFLAAPLMLALVSLIYHQSNKPLPQVTKEKTITLSTLQTANNLDGQVLGVQIEDIRPFIVEKFLKSTPLAPYSNFIVEVSDRYDIDYRLIPAIAMKESGGGAASKVGSYNAWGFENGRTNFDSWQGAIESVGKTLKTRYVDKGLTTPDEIMPIYAPPQIATGGKWARDINYFFSKMTSLE